MVVTFFKKEGVDELAFGENQGEIPHTHMKFLAKHVKEKGEIEPGVSVLIDRNIFGDMARSNGTKYYVYQVMKAVEGGIVPTTPGPKSKLYKEIFSAIFNSLTVIKEL